MEFIYEVNIVYAQAFVPPAHSLKYQACENHITVLLRRIIDCFVIKPALRDAVASSTDREGEGERGRERGRER